MLLRVIARTISMRASEDTTAGHKYVSCQLFDVENLSENVSSFSPSGFNVVTPIFRAVSDKFQMHLISRFQIFRDNFEEADNM